MQVSESKRNYNSNIIDQKWINDYESNRIFPSNYSISKFNKINSRLRNLRFLKGILYGCVKSDSLYKDETQKIRLFKESNSKLIKSKHIYRHESLFKNKKKIKLNFENSLHEIPGNCFKTIKRKSEIDIPSFSNTRKVIKKNFNLYNLSKEKSGNTQGNTVDYQNSYIKETFPIDFIYVANCLNTTKKFINFQSNNNEKVNLFPSNFYSKRYSQSFELFSKSNSLPKIVQNNENIDNLNSISIKGSTVNNVKEMSIFSLFW